VLFHVAGIDRHEIDDLHQPLVGLEDGAQDVGLVGVLLATGVRSHRAYLPEAAPPIVQQSPEEAGTVEARQAAPVDAAVEADECDGATVADEPVIADGEVAIYAQQTSSAPCRRAGGALGVASAGAAAALPSPLACCVLLCLGEFDPLKVGGPRAHGQRCPLSDRG